MINIKQEAVAAISKLPETATIDDIIAMLSRLRQQAKQQVKVSPPEVKPLSCLDLMKDHIGVLEGPEDLSTNKQYLEGLGQ